MKKFLIFVFISSLSVAVFLAFDKTFRNIVSGFENFAQAVEQTLPVDKDAPRAASREELEQILGDAVERLLPSVDVIITNYNEEEYNYDKNSFSYPILNAMDDAKIWTINGSKHAALRFNFEYTNNQQILQAVKHPELEDSIDEENISTLNYFKQTAKDLVDDSMTDYEKEVAIHDYIVENFYYPEGEVRPSQHDVVSFVQTKAGCCETYAYSFAILAQLAGVDNYMIFGSADGVDHSWNAVKIDGEYYQLDVTWDDRNRNIDDSSVFYNYFNITDEEMGRSHVWDKALNGNIDAFGEKYNYFRYNGLMFNSRQEVVDFLYRQAKAGADSVVFRADGVDVGERLFRDAFSKNGNVKGYSYSKDTSGNLGVYAIDIRYR